MSNIVTWDTSALSALAKNIKAKFAAKTELKGYVKKHKKQFIISKPICIGEATGRNEYENWYAILGPTKTFDTGILAEDYFKAFPENCKTVNICMIDANTKQVETYENIGVTWNNDYYSSCTVAFPFPRNLERMLVKVSSVRCGQEQFAIDFYYRELPLSMTFTSKTLRLENGKRQWTPNNRTTRIPYTSPDVISKGEFLYGTLPDKYIIKKRQTVMNKNKLLRGYNGKKRKKRFVKKSYDAKITNGYYQLWVTNNGCKYRLYDFVINAIRFEEPTPGKFVAQAYKFQRIT